MIVPFGRFLMLIEAAMFSWTRHSESSASKLQDSPLPPSTRWPVPDYLLFEKAFTVVQWGIVGPLQRLPLRSCGRFVWLIKITIQVAACWRFFVLRARTRGTLRGRPALRRFFDEGRKRWPNDILRWYRSEAT